MSALTGICYLSVCNLYQELDTLVVHKILVDITLHISPLQEMRLDYQVNCAYVMFKRLYLEEAQWFHPKHVQSIHIACSFHMNLNFLAYCCCRSLLMPFSDRLSG